MGIDGLNGPEPSGAGWRQPVGYATLIARDECPFEAGGYIGDQSSSLPFFSFGMGVACLEDCEVQVSGS